MPLVWCNGCKRSFSGIQYYEQHLKANPNCLLAFVQRQTPGPNGLSRMTSRTREYKRQGVGLNEFIDSVGDILKKEEAQKVQKRDLSVFDYCSDDDTVRPSKCIRVGKPECTFTKRPILSQKEMNAFVHSKIGLVDPKEVSNCLLEMAMEKEGIAQVTKATLERTECNNSLKLNNNAIGKGAAGLTMCTLGMVEGKDTLCDMYGGICGERTNADGMGCMDPGYGDIMEDCVDPGNDDAMDCVATNNEQQPVPVPNTTNNEQQPVAVPDATNNEQQPVAVPDATNNEQQPVPVPDERPLADFMEYVKKAKQNYARFSYEMRAAIELMDLMNKKGGSVALYDAVFQWHVAHMNAEKPIAAETLHKTLVERYYLGPTLPIEKTTTLPHSGETVHITCHDAKAMEADLLCDPRLTDEDYLFHNDDPYADPPEEWTTVGDVNTGLAHRKTWEKLIQPDPYTPCGRKKILCPHIIYFDATPTGHFGNLSLEIVKFTIGLLKGKTRNLSHAWRNLGYIRKLAKRGKKAAGNITGSKHVDANCYVKDPNHRKKRFMQVGRTGPDFDWELYSQGGNGRSQGGGRRKKKKTPSIKPQDFHAILQTILESYKTLEDEGGLPWDLRYKGKLYHLLLVPYILFVKADSVEANKACGLYGSNLEGVKCLCRICCIPAEQTDQPYIEPEPERKTQDMILDLVKQGTKQSRQKLKELSQNEIWNCFYRHRFGLHNKAGIHGATPMEALHWIQLNLYKYNREALFTQTGETSKLSANLDALTQTFGYCLERQSERGLPRTKYTDGIRGGKMQAHEMTGVMLLLTLTLRSKAGRNLILNTARGEQKEFFPGEDSIRMWIKMLETHLMFEQWLAKDEHQIQQLQRAKTKVKELMSLTKYVGKRTKGRGYKINSFHTTVHMPDLALELCAPIHWSTQCNESHHKADKRTAHRTSKQMETFDISHAHKAVYRHAIDLAIEEFHSGLRKWDYFKRAADIIEEPTYFHPHLTGTSAVFQFNAALGTVVQKTKTKATEGEEKFVYDDNTLGFITSIARDLSNDNEIHYIKTHGTLKMFSHTTEDKQQLFHAYPYSQGKPWNDWAIFDLSDPDSETPTARNFVAAQIKCFLDFRHLPDENALMQPPGIYAIIEPTRPNVDGDEIWWSELFEPIYKDPCSLPGFQQKYNKQELVSIDKITHPTTVVPDLENSNKRSYLRMISINVWSKMFDDWLEEEHEREYE